jgi:hypothetical protein
MRRKAGMGMGGTVLAGRDPGRHRPTPQRSHKPTIPVVVEDSSGLFTLSATNTGSVGPDIGYRRGGSGIPKPHEHDFVPDEVLIELAADTTDQEAEDLGRQHGLTRIESIAFQLVGTKLFRWRINDNRTVAAVIRALELTPGVISASANFIMRLQADQPPESIRHK